MTSPTDLPGAPDLPTPVTLARVQRLLAADGWTHEADSERLTRRWPHLEIDVTVRRRDGLLLLFRGRPVGAEIPIARTRAVESFITDWHRDRIWPVVVMTSTTEAIQVQTHVGVDATAGLTASQLDDVLRVGIGTTHQCFTTLGEVGLLPGTPGPEGPPDGPKDPPSADADPR